MTFAPTTLLELARYYEDHGGVSLGIVGNEGHTTGYHLGRDRIYDGSGPGQGSDDYSVKLTRDISGLTNAASAIDFGRLGGSLAALYDFSNWLVRQCQNGAAGSRDVREIIYSPDGVRVQRYSGVDGQIHTGPGNGDDTHKIHTHVSYYRDSQQRSKVGLIAPYMEADMPSNQAAITTTIPKIIPEIPIGADLLDLDGKTKLFENHVERLDVLSPYGVGSRNSGAEHRRAFYIDPDGAGDDTRRVVLVWVPGDTLEPVPSPDPTPDPELHSFVITFDAVEPITVTRDGAPIE